jgi:hypothetical protein
LTSKLKIGLLGIIAALLFALPGALGLGGVSTVSAAEDGDVCGIWSSTGTRANVGEHFWVMARIRDNFIADYLIEISAQEDDDPTTDDDEGSDDDDDTSSSDQNAGGEFAFIDPREIFLAIETPFISWSIDSQTGEAKIVDRIEDDDNSVPNWLQGGDLRDWYGEAEENEISPIDTALTVQILTELANQSGDDDFPPDPDSSDIWEFFIQRVPHNSVSGTAPTSLPGGAAADDLAMFQAWTNPATMFAPGNPLANCGSVQWTLKPGTDPDVSLYGDIYEYVGACVGDIAAEMFGGGPPDEEAGEQAAQESDHCTGLDDLLNNEDDDDILHLINELDGWSEISVVCTKPGEVKISADPTLWGAFDLEDLLGEFGFSGNIPSDVGFFDFIANHEGRSMDIECIGPADSTASPGATASPPSVEIHPVGTSRSQSTITVTVLDANDKRLDGASVTFTTDNCLLAASATGPWVPGQQQITVTSDTDTPTDLAFFAQHNAPGDELGAGTAEAYLECEGTNPTTNTPTGTTAGTAHVSWTVASGSPRASGLSGRIDVRVVGPPFQLRLEASPATSTCGNPVTATATVTDSAGQPVSDGTLVLFTTTTATGTQGGSEGAQGSGTTVNGVVSVTLSIDPLDAGTHTVSARTGGNDLNGHAINVVSAVTTISCSLAAGAAPPIAAPRTGTGPEIRPPNTGDGGLVADNGSWTLVALAGTFLVVAGAAAVRFARR